MIREALPTHEVHASRKVDQNLGPSFLHLSTISVYLHVRRFSRPSTHLISWNPRIEGMAFVIQVFTTTKSFFRPAVTITSDTTTHHYLQDYTFPDSLIPYLSSYLYARLVLTIDYYLPSFSGSFPPLCATRILSRSLHVFESFSFLSVLVWCDRTLYRVLFMVYCTECELLTICSFAIFLVADLTRLDAGR